MTQEQSAAQKLIANVKASDAYLAWVKEHPQHICSHFFVQINPDYAAISHWDIGFYDTEKKKVTVFSLNDAGNFEIKQTDDVFATKAQTVEELNVTEKTLDFPSIIPHATQCIQDKFKAVENLRGNGFAILQTVEGQTIWNISFITKQLTFLNLKLDAETGEAVSATNASAILPEQNEQK